MSTKAAMFLPSQKQIEIYANISPARKFDYQSENSDNGFENASVKNSYKQIIFSVRHQNLIFVSRVTILSLSDVEPPDDGAQTH